MKRPNNAKPDQEVDCEESQDIETTGRENLPPLCAETHEKSDRKQQHREGTRVDTVNKCSHDDQRKQELPAIAYLPEGTRDIAKAEEKHRSKKQYADAKEDKESFLHRMD